ncbi:MAG: hypothetical protein ACKO1J_03360 [Tagaea sp.]
MRSGGAARCRRRDVFAGRELDAEVPPGVRTKFEVNGLLAVMADFAGL